MKTEPAPRFKRHTPAVRMAAECNQGSPGMQYRIGEFARLTGISIKTLRYYDQIGLFQPAAVDPRTRYRLYIPQQLQDLAAVLALKDLGASLNDIRRVRRTASRQEHGKLLEKLRSNAEGG